MKRKDFSEERKKARRLLKKDELNGRDEKTGEGMTRRIKVS